MPKIRHEASKISGMRSRGSANRQPLRNIEHRPCMANDHCRNETIPGCPVSLCGKHVREVYSWAADMVSARWDAAVRDYVATLHATFRPPKPVKQPRSGWVYFIRLGDRVKIGYSTVPMDRLRDLPHEQVIGIVPGTREDEQAWHRLLADQHVVGEWFRATPEVLAMLADVAAENTA